MQCCKVEKTLHKSKIISENPEVKLVTGMCVQFNGNFPGKVDTSQKYIAVGFLER